MKKLIVVLLLAGTSTVASAHGYGYHGGYHGTSVDWVAPALIGGIVGYQLAQPRYVTPAPTVIYQQAPIVTYRTYPAPMPPYGYHYESILDANCNCYRNVMVPN